MPPASRSEGVTQGVRQQINKPTVYRFDGIVLDLFKQLNDTFQEENETPPIMAAHDISISIKGSIKSMREKALAEGALLQTRENAIVAMTLIGEIVATCEDIVGLELRDRFKGDVKEDAFTQAFVDLAKSFSDAERPQILNNVIVGDMESSSTTFEARLDGLIAMDLDSVIPDPISLRDASQKGRGSGHVPSWNEDYELAWSWFFAKHAKTSNRLPATFSADSFEDAVKCIEDRVFSHWVFPPHIGISTASAHSLVCRNALFLLRQEGLVNWNGPDFFVPCAKVKAAITLAQRAVDNPLKTDNDDASSASKTWYQKGWEDRGAANETSVYKAGYGDGFNAGFQAAMKDNGGRGVDTPGTGRHGHDGDPNSSGKRLRRDA
ncbi:hypothetical protein IWZ01DRAFT_542086 [Phyllosticta capitalensis]